MLNLLQKRKPHPKKILPKAQKNLRTKGQQAETLAKKHLQNKGYRFLDRNVYTPFGEIDLVFRHCQIFIFVEVKARSSNYFGKPEEAVTSTKLRHIVKSSQFYLAQKNSQNTPSRIDLVAINLKQDPPLINHIQNISQ